jgi:YfiH family protein
VFASRDRVSGRAGVVDVAFTDRYGGVSAPPYDTLDLSISARTRSHEVRTNLDLLAEAFEVDHFELMRQVHGPEALLVSSDPAERRPSAWPQCDALVADGAGVALCVRVADCVPVVLADADRGVVAVAHAGRSGVAGGVVPRTLDLMHQQGAERIIGWVGPHVCGGCYEVPAAMREEVATVAPTTYAVTTWGTPALDLGAGVRTQLQDAGVEARDHSVCTRESPDLYSYRRDGANSGRSGGLVVLRGGSSA